MHLYRNLTLPTHQEVSTLALCLLEFGFDIIQFTVIKQQAADVLSRSSKTGKDKSLLEDELPLLAIDHVVSANTSDTPEAAMKKPTYDSQTLLELIRIHINDIFCQTASAQVGRSSSEFRISSNRLLLQ